MYVCMYISMCVCMYVLMHACMYMYGRASASVRVTVCESIGLCASAVLLPYLRCSKEWIELRDIVFFDQ